MEFENSWLAFVAVLAAVAPATAGSIRPPRPAADLLAAEEATGLVWPAQVRELYTVCDGQDESEYGPPGTLFPRQPMFSLSTVVDQHAAMVEVGRAIVGNDVEYYGGDYEDLTSRMSEAGTVAKVFLPGYLPFAGEDGNFYFCDTRAGGANGCIRLYDSESADTDLTVAPSLALFLDEVTEAIGSSSSLGAWTPVVEDGELIWD